MSCKIPLTKKIYLHYHLKHFKEEKKKERDKGKSVLDCDV